MKRPQFIVGTICLALGIGLGGAFLGRAHAQQPGPRYQYMCETKVSARFWTPEVVGHWNELGAQGWQLLGPRSVQNPDVHCFERRF